MKILLFGKTGQVGWELNRSLQSLGKLVALGREDVDFSNPENLRRIISDISPDIIVNAVAYTDVDKAESDELIANIINNISVGVIAEEALKLKALFVHYSTDYVFDGEKAGAYTEKDRPSPINAYGRTKLAGENAVKNSGCDYLIFRTSWVYASRGHNFLLTILRLAKENEVLNVVNNQMGSPTSACLIADVSRHCIKAAMQKKVEDTFTSGLFNLAASGCTSWHGFAVKLIAIYNENSDFELRVSEVNEVTAAQYPTLARRPLNSRLSLDKLERDFSLKLMTWEDALHICMR